MNEGPETVLDNVSAIPNPHTTQMFCFFQSTIFSFSGGGGPEKSTPNAFFANSRNFMARG